MVYSSVGWVPNPGSEPTWFSAKKIGWVLPRVLLGLILRFLDIKFEIPGTLKIAFLFKFLILRLHVGPQLA
jgi:hypothetical protein